MVQEISKYYEKQGFDKVYVNTNKEPRRVACLHHKDGKIKTMSYAKYLYTSFHECDVADGDQVDHINEDKMDDRIENLQVISKSLNINKSHAKKTFVELKCPVCGTLFLFDQRNLPFHQNPCCSRRCGGIKSHWKK